MAAGGGTLDAIVTPSAIGLAVIITNDYGTTESLAKLTGTQRDGQSLCEAFTRLKFDVLWKRNVNQFLLMQIIYGLSRLKYHKVKHYRCIILIFAGHGCEGDCLWTQDGKKVHITSQVVTPLLPKQAMEIGAIPKIFLIDACRGDKKTQTVVVPRSSSSPKPVEEVQPRGGSLCEMRVPEEGNFMIAYSTLPQHKAYEDPEKGGVWLSTLAKLLTEGKSLNSLECLLTDVNEEIIGNNPREFQQPEKFSRLNKIINLDPACNNS